MSELTNPLFDNERDFLERQKEEYRHALLGDVDNIKTQSQEIGKKVAVAGGVLLAGYLLKRMVSGGDKKKTKKGKAVKQSRTYDSAGIPVMPERDAASQHQEGYGFFNEPMQDQADHISNKQSKSFLDSNVVKVITSQAAALLMMYITKKVSDHLNSISENDDIAAAPVEEVTVVETTEIIVPKEDAV
ncbi:hypothetical protein ABID22_000100 [Pontibacter aydingkolensis]|uniref:Uncharacterized protein n=1 Tax=Pontibacter aydingkolensis TaxID=1911536 RepID=A0ABS7CR02_9BACT|nr:hypothetical protein [Pontibacter aydingkolensis]MBW7466230.1 hypothetical protein [Pontibacter aydingkolensis]